MSRLEWDKSGERYFETGVSNGVLYIPDASGAYSSGYAWNGLTAVTESPSGAESNKQYADNQVYLNLISQEEFSGTIEAFQSPIQFDQCDGSAAPIPGIRVGQQSRKSFGLSYQTLYGNDRDGQDHGYVLHVVYGAQAAPSERAYATVNESPEATQLSWEFSTTPVAITPELVVDGRALRPTSTLSFNSTHFSESKMEELKAILWGTPSTNPRLPSPRELIDLMGLGAAVEATPAAPTFDDVDDEVTIPSTLGVRYTINGAEVTGVVGISAPTLVYAEPKMGYKFPAVTQTQWYFAPTP